MSVTLLARALAGFIRVGGPRGLRQAPQRQTTLMVGPDAYTPLGSQVSQAQGSLWEKAAISQQGSQPLDPKCRIAGDQRGGTILWKSVSTCSGRSKAEEQENRPLGAGAVVAGCWPRGRRVFPGVEFCHGSCNHLRRRVTVTGCKFSYDIQRTCQPFSSVLSPL